MGAKPASYSHGDLVVLWPDGKAPKVDDATLRRIYDKVFMPALKTDIVRLHKVMVGSLQPIDGLDFEKYLAGISGLKASIGLTAITDLKGVAGDMKGFHERFLAGKSADFEWDILDICEARKPSQIKPDSDAYLEARYRCIGFDTSEALREIGALMNSHEGRSALYIATMQGPIPLRDLLTIEWVNSRRKNDMARLRERMHECTAQLKMAQSIAYARQNGTAEPRAGDLDEAIRVANLRVVAGTAYRAR